MTAYVQLACVRFLVERRGAAVNQRDRVRGWTPLLRCAHMAHHTHAPFLDTFAYLLSAGADPTLAGAGLPDPATVRALSYCALAAFHAVSCKCVCHCGV